MQYATRVALAFASLSFFSSAAFGQTTSAIAQQQATASTTATFTCSGSFGPPMAMAAPGPTAPYSAVQESSNVQTLADGTHIARKPVTRREEAEWSALSARGRMEVHKRKSSRFATLFQGIPTFSMSKITSRTALLCRSGISRPLPCA